MKKLLLFLIIFNLLILPAGAATNIDPVERWAWNDAIGWIDFYGTNNVTVSNNKIEGYASSSVGYWAFDCATSPVPDCGVNYGVTHNGDGILRGWAWNDNIGWISVNCADTGTGCIPDYKVTIDANGNFSGWAWNDVIGWISFNCLDTGNCGVSNYRVKTAANSVPVSSELVSATYDTGGSSAFYSVMYQGLRPAGTAVKFQLASSDNPGGPWNFIGPDGQSNTYYVPTGPGVTAVISAVNHNNHRYFRYKVILESDGWQTVSPQVDDIIIGWSQ